jgi:hypothetical protein
MSRTAASAAATADGGGSGLARVTGAVGTSDEPSASSPAEVDAVERGEYPRKSRLSVLAGREDEIRVYNAEHCRWCVRQLTEVDANLAAEGTEGEETLDRTCPTGVSVSQLEPIPPNGEESSGAVGPIKQWVKLPETDGNVRPSPAGPLSGRRLSQSPQATGTVMPSTL